MSGPYAEQAFADRKSAPTRRCPFGYGHLPGTRKPGQCWTCEQREREAACSHDAERIPRWAGILGWRYMCAACGKSLGGDSGE